MSLIAAVIGRLLLALIFIVSGLQKLADPSSAAQALQAANLPATFALPTGIFEFVTGLLLAVGLMTRLVSILLVGFVALTILFFHNQFTDPAQGVQAIKNVAIIGGLLMTFAYGQMRGSYDYMRAEHRVQRAKLQAAHAEGVAEGARTVPQVVTAGVDPDGVVEVRPKRRWF